MKVEFPRLSRGKGASRDCVDGTCDRTDDTRDQMDVMADPAAAIVACDAGRGPPLGLGRSWVATVRPIT
ncbi:hypothetical protein DL991_12575 [Amycolatopsis sp. WAC 01375]|nr:hypothetical protein DL991_12575 [Amycolatopsis sp. WAC 01375]